MDETTSRLEQTLRSVKTEAEAEDFAKNHSVPFRFFYEYVNEYIARNQVVVSEMVERSGISKNYIYNILNGVTKHPGRDKVIAICIAAGMTLDELNRGLKLSGCNSLYPKNERDVYIASCVNSGERSVNKINMKLAERGIEIIEV